MKTWWLALKAVIPSKFQASFSLCFMRELVSLICASSRQNRARIKTGTTKRSVFITTIKTEDGLLDIIHLKCVNLLKELVQCKTHALKLTIGLKIFTTLRNTRPSSVIDTLMSKAVSLEIYVHLLILKMSWALTCCTKWNKTQTFTCSISKPCGAHLMIRIRRTKEMSVSMRIIGKTLDANRISLSIRVGNSANFGTQKKKLRRILMDVSLSTDARIVMAGKKRNTTPTITEQTNAKWSTTVRKSIARTITMKARCGSHLPDSDYFQEIEARLSVKLKCMLTYTCRWCLSKLPASIKLRRFVKQINFSSLSRICMVVDHSLHPL